MAVFKVWLIDDDHIQNRLNHKILSKALPKSCDIKCYTNPLSAIQEVKNGTSVPDFTFVDLDMPPMKGVDYIKEVTKLGQKTPIVILSSSIDQDVLDFAKKSHLVKRCIDKPLTKSNLTNVISIDS